MPKMKIEKELWEKLKDAAEKKGYASVEELVIHVLETTVHSSEVYEDDEDLMKRLKGLGYIS
jgi:hypothetical protein